VKAESPSAALTAIAHNRRGRFGAGGTTILDLMKIGVETPPLLVDINALPLGEISVDDGTARIGALARLSDVAEHPQIRGRLPIVALALEESASPQLRNMATIGGNLLQRTRCAYFRDVAAPCNKRSPGSGCGALHGANRGEAVLGTSPHCIATHPSDLAVALAALDTTIHVTGVHGDREIAFADFYRLPGETPEIENALDRGELIAGISVAIPSRAARGTYLKVRDRAQFEFALASAAVMMEFDDSGTTIARARIALGGVGTVPWRAYDAEATLAGARADRESFKRAAEAALNGAQGQGENNFKIPLAKRTVIRALEMASGAEGA
jgi:xanthine dehydrogenase YagS FAD-binding subunit